MRATWACGSVGPNSVDYEAERGEGSGTFTSAAFTCAFRPASFRKGRTATRGVHALMRPPEYVILAWPGQHGAPRDYHGLDRPLPAHVIPASDSRARRVWRAEVVAPGMAEEDETSLDGISDRAAAVQLVSEYHACGYLFDLVEVHILGGPTDASAVASISGFLGFDVYVPHAKSWLLELRRIRQEIDQGIAQQPGWVPLWTVLAAYFVPRVNPWGLFDEFEDAALLRDSISYLATHDPQNHEEEDREVEVYGIVRVGTGIGQPSSV